MLLMKNCVLYTMARDENEDTAIRDHAAFLRERFGAEVHIMTVPFTAVSSTQIRKAFANGEEVPASLLNADVARYAEKYALYRERGLS